MHITQRVILPSRNFPIKNSLAALYPLSFTITTTLRYLPRENVIFIKESVPRGCAKCGILTTYFVPVSKSQINYLQDKLCTRTLCIN